MRNLVFLFFSLHLITNLSLFGNDKYFEIEDLQFNENVKKIEVLDLNGDSLQEIITFTKNKNSESRSMIHISWQTQNGFSIDNTQSYQPEQAMILFDFGDVTPDPGKEFVFLTSDGVYYFSLDENSRYEFKKKKLVDVYSIFRNSDEDYVFYWNFVDDVNDDGKDEILIPQFNRYLIFAENDSLGWQQQSRLNIQTAANIAMFRNISVKYTPVKLSFADCNQDGFPDIVALKDDQFSIYYQKEDRTFHANANVRFDMQFDSENEKEGQEINVQQLKDMNDDGLLDMLATKISARESIFNPQSQIQIYLGKPHQERLFSLTPDQIIISSGVQVEQQLIDFNNDKKLDLAIPTIKLGLMRIIKMLLTKSVTIEINIYQMTGESRYPEQPDLEKDVTLTFSFSLDENSAEGRGTVPVFALNGDYNGDGYKDLLSARNQREFKIYPGKEDGVFSNSSEYDFEVTLPKNGDEVEIHDLNNDGKSDIIIRYEKQDDRTGELQKTVRVLVNKI